MTHGRKDGRKEGRKMKIVREEKGQRKEKDCTR